MSLPSMVYITVTLPPTATSPSFLVDALTVKVSSFAFLPEPLVITSCVSLDDFTVPDVVWLATVVFLPAAEVDFLGAVAACDANAATGTDSATARTAALVTLSMNASCRASLRFPAFHRGQVRGS